MLQISDEEILERLEFDNPWWETFEIEKHYKSYPHRDYFKPFYTLIAKTAVNRAAILLGPRRVGKTVIVNQSIQALIDEGVEPKKILYVSLETPTYTDITLEKLVKYLLTKYSYERDDMLYIFFDEIQYLKNWEIHLKSLVDSYPAYQFVATGSAAAALKLKSRESGAGRFTEFVLPPLTFLEYLKFINRSEELIKSEQTESGSLRYRSSNINELNNEFINYMNYGGYPEAVFKIDVQRDSARFIKSDIIDKVLLRDLPSLYGIHDVQELNRLFTTLAYNTGNEVSYETLSSNSGVAKNTIKKYLEYLEAAFLIKTVNRVDQSSKKFKRIRNFKVYLTNSSMRAALFGPVTDGNKNIGSLVETAIYSQWLHSASIDRLFYARWNDGEVDIVCLEESLEKPMWCVEVKWSDAAYGDTRIVKGLISFIKDKSLNEDALVTTKTIHGSKVVDGENIDFEPSSVYAYELGANILKTMLVMSKHAK